MTKSPSNMAELLILYAEVDNLVVEFMTVFEGSWESPIKGSISRNRTELTVPALQVITHVITHEFHHKGQILSISRLLGYTPVDTDVIRF